MAKTYLGIDIGNDMLKLALVKDGNVKKTATAPMPVNLLREGRVTSTDSFGELLAATMKENKIHATKGAVSLSGDVCYLRATQMPRMNAEQLVYNIPYEFSDYISGELKNYVFDYAVIPPLPEGAAAPAEGESDNSMPLLVSAVASEVLDDLRAALRKANLKLAKASPAECAFLPLIRDYEARGGEKDAEYCIIDLGYRAIRMYMFRGPRHVATRALDVGLSSLDGIIAEAKGVDEYLAHTYLLTNFEDCQSQDYCRGAYDNISVELMRALNFYRFSNPDSQITACWLCGGGAALVPLRESIAASLDVEIRTADALRRGGEALTDGYDFLQAIGVTMD